MVSMSVNLANTLLMLLHGQYYKIVPPVVKLLSFKCYVYFSEKCCHAPSARVSHLNQAFSLFLQPRSRGSETLCTILISFGPQKRPPLVMRCRRSALKAAFQGPK